MKAQRTVTASAWRWPWPQPVWWRLRALTRIRHTPPKPDTGLRAGLVAYWALAEASGKPRLDSHIHGLHLTDVNNVEQVAGKRGHGGLFTYVDTDRWLEADDPLLSTAGDFSVSLWAYRQTEAFDTSVMFARAGALSLHLHELSSYGLRLVMGDEGEPVLTLMGATPLALNAWTHVGLVRSGSTVKVFQNGAVAATGTVTGPVGAGWKTLIGASEFGYGFAGRLDEVSFWSRALTGDEIAALYNAGKGVGYAEF